MAEVIAKIDEVNSKSVNTSRGASTVYEVKAGGKRFSTFKAPLGKAAAELRGQNAEISYSEVQKGEFTNYYLEGIKASSVETAVISDGAVSHNITPKAEYVDKSAQINRSVAFKAAVELVAAGVLTIDGVGDLDALTTQLIPIVEGTYESGNHTGDDAVGVVGVMIDDGNADLIKF